MRYSVLIACFLGIAASASAGDESLLPAVFRIPKPDQQAQRKHRQSFKEALCAREFFGLKVALGNRIAAGSFLVLTGRETPVGRRVISEPDQQPGVTQLSGMDSESDEVPDTKIPTYLSADAVQLDGAPRQDGTEESEPEDTKKPASSRDSFAWIAGTHNSLGMLELDFQPLSKVWLKEVDSENTLRQSFGLDLTFGAKWLQGPDTPDLPPYLFNIQINLFSRIAITERLSVDAMLSPAWFTDFSNKGHEAFRLPWHLVTFYKYDDEWTQVLGITDLARDDIHYLPVVGLIYAPNDGDLRFDLVFPKPRVATRVVHTDKLEQWLYLAGELGGGSWAISRSNRAYDVVTYRDYRLVMGWETQTKKGHASRIELGWIFGRNLSYRSNQGNYAPPDSLMLRISTDY